MPRPGAGALAGRRQPGSAVARPPKEEACIRAVGVSRTQRLGHPYVPRCESDSVGPQPEEPLPLKTGIGRQYETSQRRRWRGRARHRGMSELVWRRVAASVDVA